MAKIEDYFKIEGNTLIGTVRTNKVGSNSTFPVCSVEEWEKLTDDDAEELLFSIMLDHIEWWI